MWMPLLALVFCLIVIIILFGSEYAHLASNQLSVELKRKQNTHNGKILGYFFDYPERFWSGTTISAYVFLIVFCYLFIYLSEFIFGLIPAKIIEQLYHPQYLFLLLNILIISCIILISVGVISKNVFERSPENKLYVWARPINWLCSIMEPLAKIFKNIAEFILKYLFNVRFTKNEAVFEKVNVQNFVRQSLQGHTILGDNHKELFDRALQLTKVKARKCLQPRNEIEAISIHDSIEEVRKRFIDTKLSKIVVYDSSLDNVKGYIHHLDLYHNPKSIQDILHTIPIIPETMSAIDLIHQFTKERKSIAWVMDEFGGTAGFITLEDVLEQIFGDIKDEYNIQEYVENKISDTEFIFSGRLEINYLNKKYNIGIDADDVETLSGFIIRNHETIPRPKDRIIIQNYEFEILLVSETRVEKVKMRILHY